MATAAATVNANFDIEPIDAGALDTDTALLELVTRLADVTERIRARMDRLGDLDLGSQDVFVEVIRELESSRGCCAPPSRLLIPNPASGSRAACAT